MAFDVRSYVEANLTRVADSSGDEITAECPDCGKFGSFYVNSDSGKFCCFSCDFRGKSITGLVAFVEGISWHEARIKIFREGVPLRRTCDIWTLGDRMRALRPEATGEDVELEASPVEVEPPRAFRPCWDGRKKRFQVPGWLWTSKRIKRSTARAWGLGYCVTGFYAGRLIVPIRSPGGFSFTARDMTDDQDPKYLNPSEADHSRLLIGWHVTPLAGELTLVEGPFDALRCWQNSISALGLGGKVLHDHQMAQLRTLPRKTNITIMLDPEERVAPEQVAEKLSTYFSNIWIARLPDGIDPGDAGPKASSRAIDRAKKWKRNRTGVLRARLQQIKTKNS